ncbi:MAG: rhodanese family protein [Alphaproteobacteria bacterium]|nr:rhodanese family protein [Alphaproteobacteria bacterium]MBU1527139.1 rhodanese family protein [Alphaproteobacteria bacterium]MBU2117929.1 rhodanese family protein [Alphaproteobacteria bacterium]MBU2350665.1 rhodanese family protein [Alphaproteobacteria bacterium]MBU2383282.1 rhodanese family protein [Alphaproteobacteria bacterium]
MLHPLSPAEVAERVRRGAVLIDVREPDEFARERIAGARPLPLSRFDGATVDGTQVIFTCRTGGRTGASAARLAGCVPGQAYVLDGGLEAWKAAGLKVEADRGAPIEIMRQVQMAAGGLVLLGAALGATVHPGFWGLSAFVGAGLFVAGATGFCGMARLMQLLPWNRPARV